MVFLVEFERSFIFQGFDGVFCGIVVIFGVVGMGENGVKWAFCRSWYRSGVLWFGLGEMSRKCRFYKEFVETSDVPVYLANKRSKNVIYPRQYRTNVLKYTIIVQYYGMFLSCQVKMLYTLQ